MACKVEKIKIYGGQGGAGSVAYCGEPIGKLELINGYRVFVHNRKRGQIEFKNETISEMRNAIARFVEDLEDEDRV